MRQPWRQTGRARRCAPLSPGPRPGEPGRTAHTLGLAQNSRTESCKKRLEAALRLPLPGSNLGQGVRDWGQGFTALSPVRQIRHQTYFDSMTRTGVQSGPGGVRRYFSESSR
jgi:hypothetical protein